MVLKIGSRSSDGSDAFQVFLYDREVRWYVIKVYGAFFLKMIIKALVAFLPQFTVLENLFLH